MASEANVMKTLQGQKLMFFSRYFDQSASATGTDLFAQSMNWVATAYCLDQSASAKGTDLFAQSMNWVATPYCLDQSASAKGTDLFAQSMNWVATAYCLLPLPMIGMVLNYLKHWSKERLCHNHSYH